MGFEKLNRRPLKTYFAGRNGGVYFKYQGKRYYLEVFVKTDSAWYSGPKADFIHGVNALDYWNPIYVEIVSDEYVNVYKYAKEGS